MDDSGATHGLLARCWLPGVLFAVSFGVFAVTAGYSVTSGDLWATNFGSWLLANTGSQDVGGHSTPLDPALRHVWIHTFADGEEVIARSAGVVAAGLPAYWLMGSGAFSAAPGVLTAAFITALTVVLVFLTFAQRLSRREAALGAVIFAFTTPVWSVAANGLWPHTLTVFGISGMAWASARDRWLLVGCFAVVCGWARPQTAVLIVVFCILVSLARRDLRPTLHVGLMTTLGLIGLGWWNHVTFRTFSPLGPYDPEATMHLAEDRSQLVNQLGMWVSPERGILVWTPILLVLLPAVVTSWRGLPDWSRALVWAGLGYTVVHASLVEFTGGDWFYGYRYTLELLACLTPAFAMSAAAMGRMAGAAFAPVIGLQACVILVGAVKDVLLVSSENAWRQHSFIAAMTHTPVVGAVQLAVAVAASLLARRIWLNPTISPHDQRLVRQSSRSRVRAAAK